MAAEQTDRQPSGPSSVAGSALRVTWRGPGHCPAPTGDIETLARTAAKHPLWAFVDVTVKQSSWQATLTLSDDSEGSSNSSERTFEGASCADVTAATLLVISIAQRERLEEAEPALAATVPVNSAPAAAPVPGSAAPAVKAGTPPADAALPVVSPPGTEPEPPKETRRNPAVPFGIGAAIVGELWNGRYPGLGLSVFGEYQFDDWTLRARVQWATLTNLPTSTSTIVRLTSYEGLLELCLNPLSGLALCAGPGLQHIEVAGRGVDASASSAAWFPGVSAALVGNQPRAGLGLWGEVGATFRFKEIALDVTPRGQVGSVQRLNWSAMFGPQWRWR